MIILSSIYNLYFFAAMTNALILYIKSTYKSQVCVSHDFSLINLSHFEHEHTKYSYWFVVNNEDSFFLCVYI